MSDLDRNYTSPFGRAAGRVETATVDAGLSLSSALPPT